MQINDLEFSNDFILRTPVLSFSDLRNARELLNDSMFQHAISAASPSLAVQLKKLQYSYGQLDEKSRVSIWRYRNRMMYRPTPFGKFSAISAVSWGAKTTLIAGDQLAFHNFPDFSVCMAASEKYLSENAGEILYTLSKSLYRVGDCFRYLTSEQSGEKRIFAISEIASDEILQFLTEVSDYPLPSDVITGSLMTRMQWDKNTALEYITALINAQVIVPDLQEQLNITGADYVTRKGTGFPRHSLDRRRQQNYCITVRPMKRAVVDRSIQGLIKLGLTAFSQLCVPPENGHLPEFKKRFIEKYDRRMVSLLEALDPGVGPGYGQTPVSQAKPSLLQGIGKADNKAEATMLKWSPVHRLLMKRWLANENQFVPVILTSDMLAELPPQNISLPNSLSVLFRLVNEQLFLESAGGATGTALTGRFTPVSHAVCKTAVELASNEETANPDIIFAEICHIEHVHTANIDRREKLYRYEIPVHCGTTSTADMQINLSDLFLFVSNDQLVLWSDRLRKRVIPRLSSAYNYTRSDLPVFRFLCDLQHQGIAAAFGISPPSLFPGQSHYPRVQLGEKIILAPATWIIDAPTATELCSLPLGRRMEGIREMGLAMRWPEFITVAESDQGLVFNTSEADDIGHLAAMLKPDRQLVIREWLSDNASRAVVSNKQHEAFVNQFLATLYHTTPVYAPCEPQIPDSGTKRQFVPGSEWLYYKFYLHPSVSNEVLVNIVVPAINDLKRQGLVSQWFFVRYRDPGYHIRLRLRVKPLHTGWVLARLGKILQGQSKAGVIRHFAMDTYEREIERYSAELIDSCESFFCCSTDLITSWLSLQDSGDSVYSYYFIGFSSVLQLLSSFGYKGKTAADLLQRLSGAGLHKAGQNNRQHNEFLKKQFRAVARFLNDAGSMEQLIRQKLRKPLKQLRAVAAELARRTEGWTSERRETLIGNLLHMHLNRLFIDDGQQQEAVFYYVLSRWIVSSLARYKKTSSAPAADDVCIDTLGEVFPVIRT